MIPFEEINEKIWTSARNIHTMRSFSKSKQDQIDSLIANGLEVISCGANVPLRIKKYSLVQYMEDVDHKVVNS
jgi:intracellular sulfur oxidation DsrE/DsrF family protein